jgi:ATP-dependent Clp endopeptidase proteolytic subunit ClpP
MSELPTKDEAEVRKLLAEAAAAEAQAARNAAERDWLAACAARAAAEAEVQRLVLAREQRKEAEELAADKHHYTYPFSGEVSGSSVQACIRQLATWERTAPGVPLDVTLVINSPGGGVIEGFTLIDYLLEFQRRGHKLTTVALGWAASMGGVILQAGSTRVMGKHAFLLIHQAQFGAVGSFGEVEDRVKLVEMMQDRILELFASRSKLSKKQIARRWHRRDWWIPADEALRLGFVDEVR